MCRQLLGLGVSATPVLRAQLWPALRGTYHLGAMAYSVDGGAPVSPAPLPAVWFEIPGRVTGVPLGPTEIGHVQRQTCGASLWGWGPRLSRPNGAPTSPPLAVSVAAALFQSDLLVLSVAPASQATLGTFNQEEFLSGASFGPRQRNTRRVHANHT